MVKSPKQEQRKTVWRGISVKADSRPSSTQSQDSSISWEKQPLSPLSQHEFSASSKSPPDTPTTFEDHQHEQHSTLSISPTNSTALSSSKLSSKSSNHRKEKLAELGSLTKSYNASSTSSSTTSSPKKNKEKRATTLGSLTKPYEQSERLARKEQERKERKEKEKLERQARKDQEKLDKELKEQQKKELKDQEKLEKELKERQKKELKEQQKKESKESKEKAKEVKLLKEKERMDRKSKTKSSLFSRSSKSSTPPPMEIIHTINPNLPTDDIPKSPVERRSLLSFGRPSMTSLTLKPNNSSQIDTVAPDSTTCTTTTDVIEDIVSDDSGSEEFVDFVDSHTSIRSGHSSKISGSTPHETTNSSSYQHEIPSPTSASSTHVLPSSLQPRPQQRAPKLLDPAHQQNHASNGQQSSSTPNDTNHSMFYILNSLQDAGRTIGDDDLLDDFTANKMEETQQQTWTSSSHQKDDAQGQQFDQHIQALEIIANGTAASPPPTEPLPPLPTEQQSHHVSDKRRSTDSHHSGNQHHPSTSSISSSRMSRSSSASNSSYDTVAQSETRRTSSSDHDYSHQQHHSAFLSSSPYGITAISEEELMTGPLTVKTAMDESQRKRNDDHLPDSPIDKYISNDTGDILDHHSGSESSHQDDISDDDDQQDTDSVSFESTDIPDPYLFPSDESDNQQQSNMGGDGDVIMSPQRTTPVDTVDHHPNDNSASPHMDNQPSTKSHDSVATISAKDKKMMDEALKVSTTENVAGRHVSVMQVNISNHGSSSSSSSSSSSGGAADTNHPPSLLTPMSAVIESTNLPPLALDNIEQQPSLPQQNANKTPLLMPRISSLPSSSATSLVESPSLTESPVLTESPAPILPAKSTSTSKLLGSATKVSTKAASTTTECGVVANFLKPREQEEADQPIRQGMNYLFSNKFTKALTIFKSKAESEPLHAHGLGSMLFLKSMMTYNENDVDAAMNSLTQAYTMASTQADLSEEKLSFDDTFSSLMASANDEDGRSSVKNFKSNGVLRAHVIKAESCLLMGILQLTQENMAGYLKCGLNLRKACSGYELVWKEYQQMGDQVSECMDHDTALAVQFGVGTLHILLSSLPEKIVNIFSGLSWKTNKTLGFELLKSVMIGKGTRSSFGSLILLSYYSLLSSAVPSIYAQESIQPTIECLVEAQKSHPKSCFFLYYAARISRVARNVGLSTQSFTMATTSTRRGAWAEVAMKHTVAYEVGLNHAMQLDWDTSAAYFEQLCCARDWSPAFCQYFVGACHEMLGQRQEAKDAFDEVPVLSHQQHHRKSLLDNFVQVKVERYQYQDYRDLDTCLPGLELLLLLNAFASMETTYLLRCLEMIEETCQWIDMDDDDDDDDEIATSPSLTNYGTLLLLKCAVLNALSRYNECLPILDWLMKRKHHLENEEWLLPFIYWEAGVTHWGLENQRKSREWWQLALSCTRYDFEFRMASRVHLALEKCDALGILEPTDLIGRKR
ncbi:unnamed protein product [Absidia cylindrospora]